MKALIYCLPLLLVVCAPRTIYADDEEYTDLCRLFKDNMKISVPGSCNKYIQCQSDGMGEVLSCPNTFDVKGQTCVDTVSSNTLCNNRCEGKSGVWVADPTTCHGFFYCANSVPYWSHCADGLHFDENSQMCIHETSSSCVDVANICHLVPDKTKFRDETNCASYYECSSNKHSRKSCSKTYFDVQTQACVDKAKVACTAHPIPSGLCLVKKKPFVGYKSDQATCRGFFYCKDLGAVEDLEPIWSQCPVGKFFSEDAQGCVNPVNAKCAYNRCEGRGDLMVSSANNNCHNYLICENGFVAEERTCAKDYFFDEMYQACVPDIIYYECCDIKT
ncbi:peritrophin-44 [Stomoxys calcitrans]|uniref:peritrophin-44 n=1 Tax=Stomoxys calcitrans TaxID=35570 RepID=UPI0027E31D4C|nr:peritrophin-44 [Stomoxys calcitrans]